VLSAIEVSTYWPTAKTRSITCWVFQVSPSSAQVPSLRVWSATSSSAARTTAASTGDHPSSDSVASRAISSSVMPARCPMIVCWPNS
jgi:hypothetical protein